MSLLIYIVAFLYRQGNVTLLNNPNLAMLLGDPGMILRGLSLTYVDGCIRVERLWCSFAMLTALRGLKPQDALLKES
jgi:hypothetical protein